MLGDVSTRSKTTAAQRHSVPTPDLQYKRRSTYIEASEHATENFESEQQSGYHEIMQCDMAANMVDLDSDLEWLDPIRTFNRNFSISRKAEVARGPQRESEESMEIVRGPDEGNLTATNLNEYTHMRMDGYQSASSPPELDAGHQSSDSDMSVVDEIIAEHLTPDQSMLELLPTDDEGRFGSFYSVSNEFKVSEPRLMNSGMNWDFINGSVLQSRFSWGSSVYSEASADPVADDGDVWWRKSAAIKPLNVTKATPNSPPPIPERNPLRLLHRLSNNIPKGFSHNMRRSRNIRNLQLDLSRVTKVDVRTSLYSPRKKAPSTPEKRKSKGASKEPSLALPSHILEAMCKSTQALSPTHRVSTKKKTRRSTRTNNPASSSNCHARSHSTKESTIRSTYANQVLMQSRNGHTRAASDPMRAPGIGTNQACKWNEAMPSSGCIRRSCIAGLANERSEKPVGRSMALALNKQLPPLPVRLDEGN
ncbi:hypothetical protein BDU57DRAFT_516987 [Ampelomyces quisqualis]|uniref:Uncharacterized protein n=1 Tax=Ampelomyces quisqualis TaxID=50730 RepID=A0A6A5QMP3_AMPQU|nr:hypothetical protein BDU57DRAFT_516987 [Ampelomyces quisqualis]